MRNFSLVTKQAKPNLPKITNQARPDFEQKTRFWLALFIFFAAFFLRFAYLHRQGFWDSDEYYSYRFIVAYLLHHNLDPASGGDMWGRPFGFLTSYFFMKLFGFTPFSTHIKSALFGFLSIVIGYIVGERHLGKNAGLFAAALMTSLYSLVYYSRTMKMTAPSMLFCALAIWILFEIMNTPGIQKHALCGLMLGFMITTHPATIPMAFSILMLLGIVTLIKEKNFKTTYIYGLLTLLGLAIPIIGCELFYLRTKLLPWWHMTRHADYLSNVFFTSVNGAQPQWEHAKPHLSFFLGEIRNNGKPLLYAIIAGQLFSALNLTTKKMKPFLLTIMFWLPVLIYTYILHTTEAERDIFTSLFPGCLVVGYMLARIINQLKSTGILKATALTAITIILLAYGLPRSFPIIKNASAAQNIYDVIGNEQASMTRPSTNTAQWQHYYFTNNALFVDGWNDVLTNFLLNRASYFIQLTPGWTKKTNFSNTEKFATSYKTANSNGRFSTTYLYTPKQLETIFKNKFSLTKIKTIDLNTFSSVKDIRGNSPLNELISKKGKQATITIPLNANLLVVSGKIALNPSIGEKINIAIGNHNNPTAYAVKSFSPRQRSLILPNEKATSIFCVWKLSGKQPTQLTLSALLSKHLSLLTLLTNTQATFDYFSTISKKQIKAFSVTFYHIPEQYLPQNMPTL